MRFVFALLITTATITAADLPRPLARHPGNIFIEGEAIQLTVSTTQPTWRLRDYDAHTKTVEAQNGNLNLGKLPIGYYELRRPDQKDTDPDKTTVGVIAPLQSPTPDKSPISIDVAMAWIYKDPAIQPSVINLCQLAGINWVRDRLSWPEMEPTRGHFAGRNIYDETAAIQSAAGLKVLTVNHISPPWANPDAKHFPLDLRDEYEFQKAMAARFKGKVLAMEPWNEADIKEFGGHTGSEMATLQKAAWFGQKAGNPDIITCENVFAIARQSTLDDFGANEASAYFDTYNLHHYVYLEKYPAYYAAHRAVSGGKPMWVTECNITVIWEGDPKLQEPNDTELHYGAHRVAKIFAASLYQGSSNTFYFMLPHYSERNLQYGVLHQDLTPRPAYIALAAVGRLMAGATPIGKVKNDDPKYHAYLFRAMPDGKHRFVLVGWYDAPAERPLQIDVPIEALYDNLGRQLDPPKHGKLKINGSPQFVVMESDPSSKLQLDPPPAHPARDTSEPCPVVIQALPTTPIILNDSAYAIDPGETIKIPLFAYNFGAKSAHAKLEVTAPKNWTAHLVTTELDIPPGARVSLPELILDAHDTLKSQINTIRINTTCGESGNTVLSFRLISP